MQMLYNSDSFVVVQFDVPEVAAAVEEPGAAAGAAVSQRQPRGGFEIVDKMAGKEIYLQGAVADSFQRGVKALVEANSATGAGVDQEALDDYIAGFTALAQQPVVLH